MADLGGLIGTLLTSVSHARRISDEETVAIAEHYKANPLLEGMSVPRIRIPELTIELPVLLESHEGKTENKLQSPEKIKAAVLTSLKTGATQGNIELSSKFTRQFDRELTQQLKTIEANKLVKPSKEVVIRATERAFNRTKKIVSRSKQSAVQMTPEQDSSIRKEIQLTASEVAIVKAGTPPLLQATVLTSEIKEKSSPANVVNVKITLKEEGLDWNAVQYEDGSTRNQLTPE